MRKINDTMNRLAVTAYVKGGRMKEKITGILARKEGRQAVRSLRISPAQSVQCPTLGN